MMNQNASDIAQSNVYGHNVSQIIGSKKGLSVFGDNSHSKILIATAGACDVRMNEAKVAVMSN